MGLLRILLALSVVLAHAGPLFGVKGMGGQTAVQTFFIISGFYMALILNERYTGGLSGYWLFLSNRFLRLFPVYWTVALLTLLYLGYSATYPFSCNATSAGAHCYIADDFFAQYGALGFWAGAYLFLSNLLMFGLDMSLFTTIDPSGSQLLFTADVLNAQRPVYLLLLVPQGWSLSLELMFYLLAPMLVRRRAIAVFGVMAACLALRLLIYSYFGPRDPWTYRFFPTELGLFLFGVLACKGYRYVRDMPVLLPALVSAIFIALTITYQLFPGDQLRMWAYYVAATISLPFLFRFTRDLRWDRWVGELSYPIYIVHVFVITVIVRALSGTHWVDRLSMVVVPAALLAAVGLWLVLGQPVEAWRHVRLERSARLRQMTAPG